MCTSAYTLDASNDLKFKKKIYAKKTTKRKKNEQHQHTHTAKEWDKRAALCVYHCESCKLISVFFYTFMTHFSFNASYGSVTWTHTNAIHTNTRMTMMTTIAIWKSQSFSCKTGGKLREKHFFLLLTYNQIHIQTHKYFANLHIFKWIPNTKRWWQEKNEILQYSKVFRSTEWCNRWTSETLLPFSLPKHIRYYSIFHKWEWLCN